MKMMALDEISQFKIWATKLGCPLEKIPPDETLKKYIRGKESLLFLQIMKEIRPRQEISTMRTNVLVSQLKHCRKLGHVVAKSKLHQMPEELQRFEKIEKLKAKCSETRGRIMSSINGLNDVSGKIKEKNIQKINFLRKLRETDDKLCFYRAVNNFLATMSSKELEIKETIEHLMPVRMKDSSKTKQDAANAIQLCLKSLNDFYSKYSELKQEGCKHAQQLLWSSMKIILKDIPNYYLWSILMEMKEKQLSEISEADRQQNEIDKNTTLSDQDMLQVNMAKLCGSHINLFIDLVAMKHSVQSLREDYFAKYTPFSQMLETKMNLLNLMDDEADAVLEDYMLQSTTKDYNQGQLELLSKEIERKKQEIKIQTQKLENHEQLLAQLKEIYNEIDSYSDEIQEEILLLNQIKEKVTYFKRYSRYTVHNMRQKNANQTMNLSEQSMNLTRLEGKSISYIPMYSPAVPPPYRNELVQLSDMPLSKFTRSSKISHLSLNMHICLYSGSDSRSLLSLLPSYLAPAEMSVQSVKALMQFDESLRSFTQDMKPEMDIVVFDDQHYRELWAANHEKICEQLDEIEAVSFNTRQVIRKSRNYYSFVLANALRKYVPPNKLFNGRNYREYENEYMMYYRMINGTMGEK
ncbi:augmin complex subunit dgt5 [Malaya genurostris]|uniref:augmin complex subunit dgt5 n=1 Tax=Malaya genurostris TaxID=325434 RepID=UPI0026F3AEFE|nr:augmin complex subunit dgt5 [Malaya genurostris]